MAGFVVVTKDTSKKVVAAAVKSINFHCDVLFAKAEAAEWGFTCSQNCWTLICEHWVRLFRGCWAS